MKEKGVGLAYERYSVYRRLYTGKTILVMTKETLSYKYAAKSSLTKEKGAENLLLSKFSEVEKGSAPCFYWGSLKHPFELSRCLITLSNIVQSSFNLSAFQLALLKDPIVTAGNELLRFEGFSHCAGVYARVDVLENGQDGEFIVKVLYQVIRALKAASKISVLVVLNRIGLFKDYLDWCTCDWQI